MNEEENFDWTNDQSVVVQPNDGIAIYRNANGDAVIRQQDYLDPSRKADLFICIPLDRLEHVIERLTVVLHDHVNTMAQSTSS